MYFKSVMTWLYRIMELQNFKDKKLRHGHPMPKVIVPIVFTSIIS